MSKAGEPDYIYVTTTGRKSGKPHEIEIWFVEHDGAYYLVSGGREKSDWVKNIQANPAVTMRVGTRTNELINGVGRTIDPASEPELASAVQAKMNTKYRWSDGLIVELKPIR